MKSRELMGIYGIRRETLSRWVKSGKIKVTYLPNGRYDYESPESYRRPIEKRLSIIYCRVSTSGQKDNLIRQIDRLKQYCILKGYGIDEIYKEIASALNYNRKQYRKMYEMICKGLIERVVIEYKDRLLRIGFDDFKEMCRIHNTELVVVDSIEISDKKKEIVDDMVSIIHHFSSRIYSSRKRKKIIKELENADL